MDENYQIIIETLVDSKKYKISSWVSEQCVPSIIESYILANKELRFSKVRLICINQCPTIAIAI